MERIACPNCDLLLSVPQSIDSSSAFYCSRCHSKIIEGQSKPLEATLALSIAALIFLLISLPFYFLSMDASGLTNEVGVIDIFFILRDQGYLLLSVFTFSTVILFPTIYLIALILLLAPIYLGVQQRFPIHLARMLTFSYHWSMAEVFLLGVFVGLVKLVGMADVGYGLAFFSYLAFIFCYVRVIIIADNLRIWRWARGWEQNDQ